MHCTEEAGAESPLKGASRLCFSINSQYWRITLRTAQCQSYTSFSLFFAQVLYPNHTLHFQRRSPISPAGITYLYPAIDYVTIQCFVRYCPRAIKRYNHVEFSCFFVVLWNRPNDQLTSVSWKLQPWCYWSARSIQYIVHDQWRKERVSARSFTGPIPTTSCRAIGNFFATTRTDQPMHRPAYHCIKTTF